MESIRRELCSLIEDSDLKYKEIAKIIRADKSTMTHFRNNGTISFRSLVILAHFLFPNNSNKKITEWCLSIQKTDNNDYLKQMMEYAAVTRNTDLLNSLVDVHKNTLGLEDHVQIYKTILNYINAEISIDDMIKEMSLFSKSKHKELRILSSIYMCYGYYGKGQIHSIIEKASSIGDSIKSLGDKKKLFIKECYVHRFAELMAPVYLRLNNLGAAEHYATIIKNGNISNKSVSDANYILGMIAMSKGKRDAMDIFEESYKYAYKTGVDFIITNAKNNFLLAEAYVNRKDPDKLSALLDQLKEVIYEERTDDFYIYLEKYKKGSVEGLFECHRQFLFNSDFFFSALVMRDFKDAGVPKYLIDTFRHYNYTQKGMLYFEEDFIECFIDFSNRGINCTA
ncbi:AimR family lysis-lysogeny pheromone receptor [Bacillus sp. RK1064]|uniref:AimR family lysis-lysogeny pheromone receptor n=1 Tax=Bacillus sp. RK1064 TaxID=3447561 RepID=UPI003EDAFCFB